MGCLYCLTGGTIFRGEDPPRRGSNARGCASPDPNGLWQPIRVRLAAARGRQQPTARVAPPQTLMGCGPAVAAAQYPSYTIF
jgi:hypothetical protein